MNLILASLTIFAGYILYWTWDSYRPRNNQFGDAVFSVKEVKNINKMYLNPNRRWGLKDKLLSNNWIKPPGTEPYPVFIGDRRLSNRTPRLFQLMFEGNDARWVDIAEGGDFHQLQKLLSEYDLSNKERLKSKEVPTHIAIELAHLVPSLTGESVRLIIMPEFDTRYNAHPNHVRPKSYWIIKRAPASKSRRPHFFVEARQRRADAVPPALAALESTIIDTLTEGVTTTLFGDSKFSRKLEVNGQSVIDSGPIMRSEWEIMATYHVSFALKKPHLKNTCNQKVRLH